MLRITFFFSGAGATWTESYYQAGATLTAAVLAQIKELSRTRANMLVAPYTIAAIRVTFVGTPRVAYYLLASQFYSNGNFQYTPATAPDEYGVNFNTVVLVKFYGSTYGHVDTKYMGGAPEGIFSEGPGSAGGLGTNTTPWSNALSQFMFTLAGQNSFRIFNWGNTYTVTNVLTNIAFPGEIGIQTAFQLVFGLTPPRVNLKGFRKVNVRQAGLNGLYRVDPLSPGLQSGAVAPFTYYLANTVQVNVANILDKGYVSPEAYQYDSYGFSGPTGSGFSIIRATHRKRGASQLAPRGRSRIRS